MRALIVIALGSAVAMALCVVALARRLRAAQERGDMYRAIAAQLDRRLAALGE